MVVKLDEKAEQRVKELFTYMDARLEGVTLEQVVEAAISDFHFTLIRSKEIKAERAAL